MRRDAWYLPAVIIIVAAAVRFHKLETHFLWIDEGTSWYIAKFLSLNNIWADRIYAGHFPFYFLFLKFWIMVFGDSEFSLRLPSLIPSIFSLIVFFNISKLLLKANIARHWSLFIFSFSVYGLTLAQEVRMYSAALLFFCLWIFFLIKIIKDYPRYSILYSCSLFLFLLNGSVCIIPYLGVLSFLFFKFKNKIYRRISFLTIFVLIPFLFLYSSILSRSLNIEMECYYLKHQFALKTQLLNMIGWVLRFFKDITGFSEMSFYDLPYSLTLIYFVIFVLFAILSVFGLLKLSKEHKRIGLTLMLVSFLSLSLSYKFESRYFFHLLPFIAIGWGDTMARLYERSKKIAMLFILLWGCLYINDTILYFKIPKSAWGNIADYIEENESIQDEIWLLPDFSLGAFSYYYDGESTVAGIGLGGMPTIDKESGIWYIVWSNSKLPWVGGVLAIEADRFLKRYLYLKSDLEMSRYFVTKNGEVELHHYIPR
ncbi:MAG: glycosyltransferase family 39 protein [Candidatus Kaelpia imicola]|nr:glycosyltransferase family 39 protein [Candidatus Kaelpia imicola]